MRQSLIEEYENAILFHLPNHRDVFLMIFLPVWLGGWLFGCFAAMYSLVTGTFYSVNPTTPPVLLTLLMIFWLSGWLAGGGYFAYSVSKMIFGQETLEFTAKNLIVRQRILSFVRQVVYEQSTVWHLRTRAKSDLSVTYWRRRDWIEGQQTLEFEYGPATIRCAAGISQSAAAKILEAVQEKFPQYGPRDPATRYRWQPPRGV